MFKPISSFFASCQNGVVPSVEHGSAKKVDDWAMEDTAFPCLKYWKSRNGQKCLVLLKLEPLIQLGVDDLWPSHHKSVSSTATPKTHFALCSSRNPTQCRMHVLKGIRSYDSMAQIWSGYGLTLFSSLTVWRSFGCPHFLAPYAFCSKSDPHPIHWFQSHSSKWSVISVNLWQLQVPPNLGKCLCVFLNYNYYDLEFWKWCWNFVMNINHGCLMAT